MPLDPESAPTFGGQSDPHEVDPSSPALRNLFEA